MTVEAPDTCASLSLEYRVETYQTAEIIYSAICQILTESLGAEMKRLTNKRISENNEAR